MHALPWTAATTSLMLLAMAVVSGCDSSRGPTDASQHDVALAIGSPRRGGHVIQARNCGRCHTIPGIRGANGVVGPPLNFFSRRVYIAGEVPNTPDNLVRWIMNPQSIEPGTAMPMLGLDERDAHDVAAYLYTLQ